MDKQNGPLELTTNSAPRPRSRPQLKKVSHEELQALASKSIPAVKPLNIFNQDNLRPPHSDTMNYISNYFPVNPQPALYKNRNAANLPYTHVREPDITTGSPNTTLSMAFPTTANWPQPQSSSHASSTHCSTIAQPIASSTPTLDQSLSSSNSGASIPSTIQNINIATATNLSQAPLDLHFRVPNTVHSNMSQTSQRFANPSYNSHTISPSMITHNLNSFSYPHKTVANPCSGLPDIPSQQSNKHFPIYPPNVMLGPTGTMHYGDRMTMARPRINQGYLSPFETPLHQTRQQANGFYGNNICTPPMHGLNNLTNSVCSPYDYTRNFYDFRQAPRTPFHIPRPALPTYEQNVGLASPFNASQKTARLSQSAMSFSSTVPSPQLDVNDCSSIGAKEKQPNISQTFETMISPLKGSSMNVFDESMRPLDLRSSMAMSPLNHNHLPGQHGPTRTSTPKLTNNNQFQKNEHHLNTLQNVEPRSQDNKYRIKKKNDNFLQSHPPYQPYRYQHYRHQRHEYPASQSLQKSYQEPGMTQNLEIASHLAFQQQPAQVNEGNVDRPIWHSQGITSSAIEASIPENSSTADNQAQNKNTIDDLRNFRRNVEPRHIEQGLFETRKKKYQEDHLHSKNVTEPLHQILPEELDKRQVSPGQIFHDSLVNCQQVPHLSISSSEVQTRYVERPSEQMVLDQGMAEVIPKQPRIPNKSKLVTLNKTLEFKPRNMKSAPPKPRAPKKTTIQKPRMPKKSRIFQAGITEEAAKINQHEPGSVSNQPSTESTEGQDSTQLEDLIQNALLELQNNCSSSQNQSLNSRKKPAPPKPTAPKKTTIEKPRMPKKTTITRAEITEEAAKTKQHEPGSVSNQPSTESTESQDSTQLDDLIRNALLELQNNCSSLQDELSIDEAPKSVELERNVKSLSSPNDSNLANMEKYPVLREILIGNVTEYRPQSSSDSLSLKNSTQEKDEPWQVEVVFVGNSNSSANEENKGVDGDDPFCRSNDRHDECLLEYDIDVHQIEDQLSKAVNNEAITDLILPHCSSIMSPLSLPDTPSQTEMEN
ncbi:uncharacterized protein LOC108683317 [Hyalella azteca]|uniref:Uncharacterized protein LOC108683317 n=1 Tax=Hyalella azteca TaxID=294128 RepID=A0A8B7PRJ5_HYAAZ|nr:uncharacterized protein LOC108683317 [Hyalella azteca]